MVRTATACGLLAAVSTGCEPVYVLYDKDTVGQRPQVDDGPFDSGQLDDEDEPVELVADCLGGGRSELVQVKVLDVQFPTNLDSCDWDAPGNLEPQSGHLTARFENIARIGLDKNQQICDLQIRPSGWSDGDRLYDDHFLLTVSDVVVASSTPDLVETLTRADGLPLYDWDALAGTEVDFSSDDGWCLGEQDSSTCIVPGAAHPGPFTVMPDPAARSRLVERMNQVSALPLGLVVFGDDDWSDCTHASLDVELTFGLQPR